MYQDSALLNIKPNLL